ncbi:DUF3817 domain-containing protein [Nocardia yunnanensis]|uniref:DUF3817 domain-containing protein n=1 Tax=Nocardia yunnanensis TaxID=2382165 RepID=A0A386ZJ00_9NOCA|nr:DUF3817 domain-containing protein [Nocardia yunnanensis]AYF77537.1 DUF3817 domain-containing protein [Nocardia yunnanensis]
MNPQRTLRLTAAAETLTLLVLLVNLATVHWPAVSSLVGPLHGCAYIAVVVLAFKVPESRPALRALAVIPIVGGLVVLGKKEWA